jgi:hypothetical protein
MLTLWGRRNADPVVLSADYKEPAWNAARVAAQERSGSGWTTITRVGPYPP